MIPKSTPSDLIREWAPDREARCGGRSKVEIIAPAKLRDPEKRGRAFGIHGYET
jgi:hypothetical protein